MEEINKRMWEHEEHQLVWQQPPSVILTRILNFLVKKKAACLAAYEHKVWLDVQAVENCTFGQQEYGESDFADKPFNIRPVEENLVTRAQLRKVRNKIYVGIRSKQSVKKYLKQYDTITEVIISGFDADLSLEEVKILRKRVQRTKQSAKVKHISINHNATIKCNLLPRVSMAKHATESTSDIGKVVAENVDEADLQAGGGGEVKEQVDISPMHGQKECHSNQLILETQEPQVLILPDVPTDCDDEAIGTSVEIDADIERR